MKIFKNIIAIVLVLSISNVILGKAIHEFFEHDHVEHTCDVKDITHYHEFEFSHLDFICDFNLNATDSFGFQHSSQAFIAYYQTKIDIIYLWLVNNLCQNLNLQRGPPSSI